jgi:hypothetical protein
MVIVLCVAIILALYGAGFAGDSLRPQQRDDNTNILTGEGHQTLPELNLEVLVSTKVSLVTPEPDLDVVSNAPKYVESLLADARSAFSERAGAEDGGNLAYRAVLEHEEKVALGNVVHMTRGQEGMVVAFRPGYKELGEGAEWFESLEVRCAGVTRFSLLARNSDGSYRSLIQFAFDKPFSGFKKKDPPGLYRATLTSHILTDRQGIPPFTYTVAEARREVWARVPYFPDASGMIRNALVSGLILEARQLPPVVVRGRDNEKKIDDNGAMVDMIVENRTPWFLTRFVGTSPSMLRVGRNVFPVKVEFTGRIEPWSRVRISCPAKIDRNAFWERSLFEIHSVKFQAN